MESLIRATAWAMEKPQAYGAFHLSFALIGFVLSLFFAWKFRKLGTKGNRILLTICGVFFKLFN